MLLLLPLLLSLAASFSGAAGARAPPLIVQTAQWLIRSRGVAGVTGMRR